MSLVAASDVELQSQAHMMVQEPDGASTPNTAVLQTKAEMYTYATPVQENWLTKKSSWCNMWINQLKKQLAELSKESS